MRETWVEEEFARFADDAAGTFRPVPLDALRPRPRRRRVRVWFAGLVVGAIAAGGGVALQTAGRHAPKPSPTGFQLVERPVVLAGGAGPHQVRFADRQHGWVLYHNCDRDGRCDPRLGRTDDGGRTWRPRPLPDVHDEQGGYPTVGLLVLDAERIALVTRGEAYWSSIDAGGTWTREDPVAHAGEIERASASATTDTFVVSGTRLMLDGFGDVGVVPVRDGTSIRAVVRTPGGSLWALLDRDRLSGRSLLVFSADGTTWQDVREEPSYTYLWPAPDRSDVWYTDLKGGDLALLSDGRVLEQPGAPGSQHSGAMTAIGGGRVLVVTGQGGLRLWSAATGTGVIPVPVGTQGVPVVRSLADGAVIVLDGDGMDGPVTVGTVGGTWVRYS